MGPWKGRLVSRARARERNGIPEKPGFPLKRIGNVSIEHVHDYEHVHVFGRADCL